MMCALPLFTAIHHIGVCPSLEERLDNGPTPTLRGHVQRRRTILIPSVRVRSGGEEHIHKPLIPPLCGSAEERGTSSVTSRAARFVDIYNTRFYQQPGDLLPPLAE